MALYGAMLARVASGALPRCVVIVGPTGCGKTRLAVDIAAALGGEVVNADAMQM